MPIIEYTYDANTFTFCSLQKICWLSIPFEIHSLTNKHEINFLHEIKIVVAATLGLVSPNSSGVSPDKQSTAILKTNGTKTLTNLEDNNNTIAATTRKRISGLSCGQTYFRSRLIIVQSDKI